MSVNLVSLVSQYLTPELIGRIAAAVGLDRSLVGRSIIALTPAILGSLARLAASPAGAQRLTDAIEKQGPGILDTLHSAIGESGQEDLVHRGLGTFNSLLGGSALPALAGALGKFTGITQEAASTLIGVLSPAVLGVLGKEKAAQGLDASGLSQLLAAQKENIAAALPSGFGDILKAAAIPGFGGEPPREAPPRSPEPAGEGSSSPLGGRLALILGLAAALLLAWWYFGNRPGGVSEQAKTSAGSAAKSLPAGEAGVKASIQTALDGLKAELQSVSDKSSAQAAIPQLEKGATELDKLRELATALPADSKSAIAALVTAVRPSIEELFNKILAIPGVETIAKPVIEGLRAQLDALSKA